MENKPKPELREVASAAIRDRWSSYPSAGLTPRRLTAILRDADAGNIVRQMELFAEMEEKDAHLFSCLQTRKLAVSGLPWTIEGEAATADFVHEALDGLDNFEEALMDLMDALGKGFSVSEIIWEAGRGQVTARALKKRPQKKFRFAAEDGLSMSPRLVTEDEPVNGVPLVDDKFIVHMYRAGADLPERGGLLRVLSWMYLFKNYAFKDWVTFCEVFGMPLRLGIYSPNATKEDREALINAVTNLGSDAAGIISESTKIEFVEAAGKGGASPYRDLVELINKEMSKAVLGQTLTSDVGGNGSYAAGMVHQVVRDDIMRADARALERTINRGLVRPLVMFNFGGAVKPPKFRFVLDREQTKEKK
jgi:phage gp29-like protein